MICTSCGKSQAVVFIKTIVNNKVSQSALCADCAARSHEAFNPSDALLEMLSGVSAPRARAHPPRCPGCRTSFADFRTSGRFGCPHCYEHFAALIKGTIPRIHGGAYQHRGKSPRKA